MLKRTNNIIGIGKVGKERIINFKIRKIKQTT
jgi:hypothetical protein